VKIINRWGTVVRQYNGLTSEWDGKANNGEDCSDGVYFIVANAVDKFGHNHEKTKTFTLVR